MCITMSKFRRVFSLGLFLAAFLFLTTGASAEIIIGFHAPLTGFAAGDGKSAKIGAELALEQINAKGGINGEKVSMVIYDDQAKANQAENNVGYPCSQCRGKISV